MKRSASGIRWLFVLVLPSALGLLTFGLVGMMSQTRRLHDEVRDESLAAAKAEARNLKQIVEDPKFLEKLPAECRYQVLKGSLVVPEFLGPLDESFLQVPAGAFASPAVLACLREASSLEFEKQDVDESMATIHSGLDLARDDEDRGLLLNRLAWLAHRHGRAETRDQALVDFDNLQNPSRADSVSILVLHLIVQPEGFEPVLRQLMLMPVSLALLHCERIRDLAAELATDLEMLYRQRLRLRQRLMEANERAQARLVGSGGLEGTIDGQLFFLSPNLGPTVGREIALAEPTLVLQMAGVDSHRFALGPRPPENSAPAVPLIYAVPTASSDDDEPDIGFTVLLLAGLSITFVTGLSLATRALHREALAAKARTEFLTSVTHELKTPLASIRLIAEMLEMDLIPEESRRRDYYSLLSGETARLSMLIENVLDLGRMERGERAYDRRRESLTEVVMSAVELFRPVAQRDGLAMTTALGETEVFAKVDRGAIVQALLNILENSRKYAAAGERIDIVGRARDNRFELELRDFGPGIPDAELAAVFERFKRGAAQADGRIAGVGLGLHLSRRIIEDHHGTLIARKPKDGAGGVTFLLDLPLVESGGSEE